MKPLHRVIAQFLSSPSTANKTPLLVASSIHSAAATGSKQSSRHPDSTMVNKAGVDWPKPSEIPFQPKVANSINLIGHICMPIRHESTPDGNFWARTAITRPFADSPPFLIPIAFTGDLAHIAVSHLKVRDYIYVKGEFSVNPPPRLDGATCQSHLQVMVHSINFVEESPRLKKKRMPSNHDISMSGPGI